MSRPEYRLYMLRCADDSLYTGVAIDVERRLQEHASGPRGAKYLRGRGPLQLVFCEKIGDRASAQRLERVIKNLPKAQKEDLATGRTTLADLVGAEDLPHASGAAAG